MKNGRSLKKKAILNKKHLHHLKSLRHDNILLRLVKYQISELGNKQTTTLVFENKEFNLKTQT